VIHHDLSKLGFNFAEGLSDGAIWALIAIGYTLVYGNHRADQLSRTADVFMIGLLSHAVGLWGPLGPRPHHRPRLGLAGGLLVTAVHQRWP